MVIFGNTRVIMKANNITVWSTCFSCGECAIYIDNIDGETLAKYEHTQYGKLSAKDVFAKTGKIKGSYRGICYAVDEIKRKEKEFLNRVERSYNRYWGFRK